MIRVIRVFLLSAACILHCSSEEQPCAICPDASNKPDASSDTGIDVIDLDASDAATGPLEGVYEACDTEFESTCLPRLQTIHTGGFGAVLNYALLVGSAQNVTDYMKAAEMAGIKVIAALDDTKLWQLTQPASTLAPTFSLLLASCGSSCTTVGAFVSYVIGLIQGSTALWGYYIGDEINTSMPGTLSTWQAYSAAVHAADPAHPRLVVEGTSDGMLTNPQITAIAPHVEVVAQDFYPIGDDGLVDAGHTGAIAAGVRADALDAGASWGMVLQAMSWQSYAPPVCNPDASAGCTRRCAGFPMCAPFPSEAEMQSMKDQVLALGAPRPSLVLWYSYFDVLRAPQDGGAAAWAALTTAVAAP